MDAGGKQLLRACNHSVTPKSRSFYMFSTASSQLAFRCLERAANAAGKQNKPNPIQSNYEINF
jgi:hypothetical protein